MTTINVEQRHIDEGEPCNSDQCAVTLAMNECLNERYGASATVDEIALFDFKERLWIKPLPLPPDAIEWVAAFDEFPIIAKPFSFDLDIPQELLKATTSAPAVGDENADT